MEATIKTNAITSFKNTFGYEPTRIIIRNETVICDEFIAIVLDSGKIQVKRGNSWQLF